MNIKELLQAKRPSDKCTFILAAGEHVVICKKQNIKPYQDLPALNYEILKRGNLWEIETTEQMIDIEKSLIEADTVAALIEALKDQLLPGAEIQIVDQRIDRIIEHLNLNNYLKSGYKNYQVQKRSLIPTKAENGTYKALVIYIER